MQTGVCNVMLANFEMRCSGGEHVSMQLVDQLLTDPTMPASWLGYGPPVSGSGCRPAVRPVVAKPVPQSSGNRCRPASGGCRTGAKADLAQRTDMRAIVDDDVEPVRRHFGRDAVSKPTIGLIAGEHPYRSPSSTVGSLASTPAMRAVGK
jgi:hypothetical protein